MHGRVWPRTVAFWAPSPKNTITVDRNRLSDSLLAAVHYREQILEGATDRLKKGLLRLELDALGDEKIKETNSLLQNLDQLQDAITELASRPCIRDEGGSHSTGARDNQIGPTGEQMSFPQNRSRSYSISVVQGDPPFTISDDLRRELIAKMYTPQHNWLPNFGRWYTTFTSAAMQRRVFPKELRGTGNFQNSTSQKLMRAVTDVILTVTADFYNDVRHLADSLSGLCLLNAYYVLRNSRANMPTSLPDLWANLGNKLKLLSADLRSRMGDKRTFAFVQTPAKQAETIAPLNRQNKYAPTFFSQHALFQLLRDAGLFPNTKDGDTKDSEDDLNTGSDITLAITSSLFGERIPPFLSHQWNLRAGLISLEVFLLTFILLENVQVTRGSAAQNRLQFKTLLGDEWVTGDAMQFHKRGTVFDYLVENYMGPTLIENPETPISTLLPGVILLAFEAHAHTTSSTQPIQLTTKKFNDIFEIINQRYTFRDAGPLLRAHASLRISIEEGLSAQLSSLSGGNFAQEILKTQFGVKTDYDLLYFLVLGFLPAAVALV